MMIAVGGVYADYHMNGKDVVVTKVYRKNGLGNGRDYVYNDSRMVDHAMLTIRAVKDGWMTIGKGA